MKAISTYSLVWFITLLALSSCNSDSATYAMIETDMGNIKVELYDSTPKHRDNFIKLAKEGFYDDLLFHRVMQNFMIQGGDPDSRTAKSGAALGVGGPGYRVDAEIGSPHFKGTLAAARQGDAGNPEKKSSGSQFYLVQGQPISAQYLDNIERSKGIKYSQAQRDKYISLGGTPQLDMEYTVFGEIVDGLDVVDKIAAVQVDGRNRPLENVKMKVRILN